MVKEKEEVEVGKDNNSVPEPEVKKEDKWVVAKAPTQFEPVLMKGEEVLDTLSALALILNKVEEIQDNGGFK